MKTIIEGENTMSENLEKFLENKFGDLSNFPLHKLEVDGESYENVKIVGDAECFDKDEFFQYIFDGEKLYKAYFDINNVDGEMFESVDMVDYSQCYRIEDVTDEVEDLF